MVKLTKTAVAKFTKVGKKNNDPQRGSSSKNSPLMKKANKAVKSKKSTEQIVENVNISSDLKKVKENVNTVKKSEAKLDTVKLKKATHKTLKNEQKSTIKNKNQVISLSKKVLEANLVSTLKKKNKTTTKITTPRVMKSEVKVEASQNSKVKRKKVGDSEEPAGKKLKKEKPLKHKKQSQSETGSEGSKATISLATDAKNLKLTDNVVEKVGDLKVTKAHVKKCIKAVLHLVKKTEDDKKSLLPNDDNPIFLQVNCIKIPKVPRRQLRIYLPHMMVGQTDDVALFVPDLERGRRKDYEKTVDHWETILREANVTRIKEVIPMNKVKTEFSQYEMKLKLARMFDFFLVDGRIAGHMAHLLGKTFKKSARPPTPVKLQRDNLKSQIDNALRKTAMEIHGFGSTHTVQVASVSMPEKEIIENVIAACKALEKDYPGGWENIRSIMVKTAKSLAIPVYFSIQNANKVPVAKIEPKRPKAYKTVEGELSTVAGNVVVEVAPEGTVTVKKIKKEKDGQSST